MKEKISRMTGRSRIDLKHGFLRELFEEREFKKFGLLVESEVAVFFTVAFLLFLVYTEGFNPVGQSLTFIKTNLT